jgi:hypothetical protein
MFGAKFFAGTTSILFTTTSQLNGALFKKQLASCDGESAAAQKGADDLEKILAGTEGGLPPDPEEIQELLMKAQGRSIR